MPEGREDTERTLDTHSLLLSLAGLLDDELLGWCRELVAVGESDYALELVTSTVQADRVRLPPAPHEQLHAAASRRGLLGRGETLPPPEGAPKMRHRFLADPAAGGFPVPTGPHSPEHALASVPPRLLRNCQLWLSWRATPAGSAPGPLPHPVLLIEADEADGVEVLAYQVGEVLLRAGVFASVEVFAPDIELSDYHRAALAEGRRIEVGGSRPDDTGANRRVGPGPAGTRPEAPGVGPVSNGVVGSGPHNGVPTNGAAARPRPARPADEDTEIGRSGPMRPVDRVIAARNSTPRRPRPDKDRADTGFDEIAAGLTFDRPPAGGPDPFGADGPGGPPTAPGNGVVEPPGDRRPAPPAGQTGSGAARSTTRPGADRTGSNRPTPPGGSAANRPPARSDDRPSDEPLSEVEQRLLRQLHEELAAREDETSAGPDGPRMFRGGNGRKPRPNRPSDPPKPS